uniref:THAP-type domain-containing protein n=1 Tax=Photinus pyralis TaxID=7054 RepID=A0A1Y1JZB1_PHOPY
MDLPYIKYKLKCCVPGCTDKTSKRHRFPKDVQMLRKWVEVIQNSALMSQEPYTIYKSSYVCDRHFSQEYLVPGTRRGLSRIAVPTLYLTAFPDVMSTSATSICSTSGATSTSAAIFSMDTSVCVGSIADTDQYSTSQSLDNAQKVSSVRQDPSIMESIFIPDIDTPTTSTTIAMKEPEPSIKVSKRRRILNAVEVTRQNQLTPRCKKMYQIVTEWGKKTAKLQHTFGNLQKRLALAEKVAKKSTFTDLMDAVNETTYKFILQQIRTQQLPPKARRFSLDDKILALSLLKASGKGYRLLSKIFCLPSRRTLTNLLNKVPYRPGINKHIVNSLESVVANLSTNEKLCAVVFDEMAISPSLHYNSKLDCIEGVADYGGKRYPHLADYANVFMIKGVYRQWKQPFSFTFSNGPLSSTQLKQLIEEVITVCQQVGLKVVATICDQGSANQAAINALLKDANEYFLQKGMENPHLGFFINNQEIVPLYDVPHLFKGLRNNLLTKNLHFTKNGVEQVATWKHIELLYFLDTYDDTRLLTKLTDAHVMANKINKMKVSSMTQVFSYGVGSHLQRFAGWDTHTDYSLPSEANQTGELVLFIDKLFDSLNGNRKLPPASKPLKGAFTLTSGHEEFWSEAIHIIRSMKYCDPKTGKLARVPSVTNLQKTVKGFIYFKTSLLHKVKYILPRAFNQDCLENFFACLRGYGRRNVCPNVNHFIPSFKALLINNFLSTHSIGANCEYDFNVGALDNLRVFVTGEDIAGISPFEADIKDDIPVITHCKKTPVAKATIAYVAGFIGRRVLKKTKCVKCKELLTASDGNVPLQVIEAREYKNSQLFRPGSCLYFLVSQTCTLLFYLIPRHCHQYMLRKRLVKYLTQSLNFNILNCTTHTQLGTLVVNLLVTTILHFWCKQVGRILSGTDQRFVNLVSKRSDVTSVDPVKLEALKKYKSKLKKKFAK